MANMKPNFISIVVPSHNEEGNVGKLYKEIKKSLPDQLFEIIFVDDGSTDGTLSTLKVLHTKHSEVKYLSFSRNFGHQAALRAGLRAAKGQAVISMDADLQHPPELLSLLMKEWQNGNQVVYTVRQDGQGTTLFKRLSSKYFYRVINFLSGLNIEEGAADFRLLDRKVVNVINEQHEADIFLRGYINWMGFKQVAVPYTPAARFSGTSKYSLKKMLDLAGNGVTQFSVKPLRLAFGLSFFAFIIAIAYVGYSTIAALMGRAVPGWLSLVVLFVFLQGIQFLLLGLMGEYLGRTFMQTKNRPDYIIDQTNEDVDN
jgi:glycosyltransferase involved in cell wall biosynthesis